MSVHYSTSDGSTAATSASTYASPSVQIVTSRTIGMLTRKAHCTISSNSSKPSPPLVVTHRSSVQAKMESYHTVAVIGAGLSGLYAAQLLKAQVPDVVVLEAQDRIGGRVKQVRAVATGGLLCIPA